MKEALRLAPRLAVERLRGARGGAALDVFAVLAFTVSALVAYTVAGGTWMFVQWNRVGNPTMETNLGLSGADAKSFTYSYVAFAAIACALLVVPILSLGGAAARLGASGRSRRLASLRLIGMTGGQVVLISVVETLVQALIGIALGTILWQVSLPLWGAVSFQSVQLAPELMRGPFWLWLSVSGVIVILAMLSTVLGLQRVRISPLGVAARQTPPALKWWRVAVFAVVAVGAVVFANTMEVNPGDLAIFFVLAGFIGAVILVINLVGPFILQLLARLGAKTGSVPQLLAMRRISDDPKAAWRNISSLVFLGFLAAFMAIMPQADAFGDTTPEVAELMKDVRTGIFITLMFGFVLGAVSTLLAQAAAVVDRAGEARAMDHMGVPRRVFGGMRRRQVLMPLLTTLIGSMGVGLLMGFPVAVQGLDPSPESFYMLLATVVVGVALVVGAAQAVGPLQNRILAENYRRND